MHETIQAHFQALEDAVRNTAIAPDRRKVIATSIARLSALYIEFRRTDESRYGDEITRVVQSVLKELAACPEAQKLEADCRQGLQQLHEELGLPGLVLKAPPGPPKPRKARKK